MKDDSPWKFITDQRTHDSRSPKVTTNCQLHSLNGVTSRRLSLEATNYVVRSADAWKCVKRGKVDRSSIHFSCWFPPQSALARVACTIRSKTLAKKKKYELYVRIVRVRSWIIISLKREKFSSPMGLIIPIIVKRETVQLATFYNWYIFIDGTFIERYQN